MKCLCPVFNESGRVSDEAAVQTLPAIGKPGNPGAGYGQERAREMSVPLLTPPAACRMTSGRST